MSNENIQTKIKIDTDLKQLMFVKKEVDHLDKSFKNIDKVSSGILKRFGVVGHVVDLFKEAAIEITKAGITYNSQVETLTNNFKNLVMISSENETVNGRTISFIEKQNMAQREAKDIMKEIEVINTSTPHTLQQTAEIYKSMYPSMKQIGLSNKDIAILTEKISFSAANAGIKFQDIVTSVDDLSTGTVSIDNEFGQLLKNIGLTNEELKKSDNLFVTINGRLKDTQGSESFDVSLAKTKSSFNAFAGELTKPIMEPLQEGLQTSSSILDELTQSIKEIKLEMASIDEFSTLEGMNKKMISLANEWNKYENKKNLPWLPEGAIEKHQKDIEGEISILNTQLENLFKNTTNTTQLKPNIKKITNTTQLKPNIKKITNTTQLKPNIKKITNTTDNNKSKLNVEKTTKYLQEQNEEWQKYINTMVEADTKILKTTDTITKQNEEWEKQRFQMDKLAEKLLNEADIENFNNNIKTSFDSMNDYTLEGYNKVVLLREELLGEAATKEQQKLIEELFEDKIKNLNDVMLLSFENTEKETQKTFKRIDTEWDKIMSSMNKSLEDNLFELFNNGFDDLGNWTKNLSKDLIANITTPLYKSLSGNVAQMIFPTNKTTQLTSLYDLNLINNSGMFVGPNEALIPGGNAFGDSTSFLQTAGSIASVPTGLAFLANPIEGISSAYSGLTNGMQTLGNSIQNGLAKVGLMESTNSTSMYHAVMTGQSGGTLGSTLAAATPYLLGAAAAYTLYSWGWSDWQKKASGYAFGDEISANGGLDSAQIYDWFKKKSAWHSKTKTEFKDLEVSQKIALSSLFGGTQQVVDALGGGLVDLGAGRYEFNEALSGGFEQQFVKETLSEIMNIPKMIMEYTDEAFIDYQNAEVGFQEVLKEIENPDLTNVYNAWADYAKSIDKTVVEALQETLTEVMSTQRSYTEWLLKDDDVELAQYKASYLQKDAKTIAQSLDVDLSTLTAESFYDRYNKAIATTFDPALTKQWGSLADAFMKATDAQEAYKTALLNQQNTQYTTTLNSLQSIYTLNSQILTLENQIALERDGISQDNLSLLREQTSAIESMMTSAQNMRDRLLTSDNILGAYQSAFLSASNDFSLGNYDSSSISRYKDVASQYADSLHTTVGNYADYEFGVLKIANDMESITGNGKSTLEDVQDEIKRVEKALGGLTVTADTQLDALYSQRDTYVEQTQREIDKLEELLGGNSSLIVTLEEALVSASNGSSVSQSFSSSISDYTSTREDYVRSLYTEGLNRTPTEDEVNYWTNESLTPTTELASIFQELEGDNFKAFANGGYTGDNLGLVHPHEYVLNAETSSKLGLNDSSSTGVFGQMVSELKALRTEVKQLREETKKVTNNTKESRFGGLAS